MLEVVKQRALRKFAFKPIFTCLRYDLQVLMRVEQEQKVTEDARIAAEQDVAAQKYAVHVLQV